ncbi:MAG TPA: class I SAM-dependent methyltransferase [Pirellulales bacterium]|jgi:SAM-dependent methyltransferase|nr:class I SAM-dependent methyltransferase [Pirellulales bacterium]
MANFKDHFSAQSRDYGRFRPHYPRALFEFLAELPAARSRAWDCGTGNGQAAGNLAEFFAEVIATDPSVKQLAQAVPRQGVTYVAASAEQCPLRDRSVDLVTVAQAVHWFDLPAFYRQVRRVAAPAGAIAVWSYGLANITPEIDTVVGRLYDTILGAYWPPERSVVESGYSSIAFDFDEIRAPAFAMTAAWTLPEYLGYVSTWSAVQHYRRQRDRDPLDLVRGELEAAWGSIATPREVKWPFHLRVGRVG